MLVKKKKEKEKKAVFSQIFKSAKIYIFCHLGAIVKVKQYTFMQAINDSNWVSSDTYFCAYNCSFLSFWFYETVGSECNVCAI